MDQIAAATSEGVLPFKPEFFILQRKVDTQREKVLSTNPQFHKMFMCLLLTPE